MKIKQFEYKNRTTGWQLEKTKFSDLNLLVGVSGAGKTQILAAINNLLGIIFSYSFNGIEWDLYFETDDNKNYHWLGAFESRQDIEQKEFYYKKDDLEQIPKIEYEKLYLENNLIFERELNEVKFFKDADKIPKISSHRSVLNVFSEDENILPVIKSFEKIHYSNYESGFNNTISETTYNAYNKMRTLKDIRNLRTYISLKLFLSYKYLPYVFEAIKEDFIEVFNQVEDIRLITEEKNNSKIDIILQIKEKGTNWISMNQISLGMFKTLVHIAEMRLLTDGSVILIDEFENSLGINCIDVVTDILTQSDIDLQFIITSHHPYIINRISMDNWKIVTRKSSVVKIRDAKEFNLGKSKHKAFKQLINLEAFRDGVE